MVLLLRSGMYKLSNVDQLLRRKGFELITTGFFKGFYYCKRSGQMLWSDGERVTDRHLKA